MHEEINEDHGSKGRQSKLMRREQSFSAPARKIIAELRMECDRRSRPREKKKQSMGIVNFSLIFPRAGNIFLSDKR